MKVYRLYEETDEDVTIIETQEELVAHLIRYITSYMMMNVEEGHLDNVDKNLKDILDLSLYNENDKFLSILGLASEWGIKVEL